MPELHDLTALEQGAAVRAGEVSPVELVEHYLERVRASPTTSARSSPSPGARAQAGGPRRPAVGDGSSPLYGVPTAIKDLTATAGVARSSAPRAWPVTSPRCPTRSCCGSRRPAWSASGRPPRPEFGSPCYTEPDNAPPARPRGTSTGWPAARAAAPRRRSPPAWCRWRRAPTAAARSGSRRAAAGCSASSRPGAGSAAARCTATRSASAWPGRWPARCATPPPCST